jgi:hypothetical protein
MAIAEQARSVIAGSRALYNLIRAAKARGYSFNELEQATGFPRGTVQNVVAGRNPRLTVY